MCGNMVVGILGQAKLGLELSVVFLALSEKRT